MTLGGDADKTFLYTKGLSETDDSVLRLSSVTLSGEKMSDLELQKYFEFNEADRIANRAGKLSKKQEETIRASEASFARSTAKFSVSVILFGIALSAAIILFGMPGEISLDGLKYRFAQDAEGMMAAIGIPGILVLIFVGGAFLIARTKVDHSVQKAEGKVNFVKVEKRDSDVSADGTTKYHDVEEYELRVGRKAFENVDEEMLNLINEGDTYAFYYTKDAEQILSCELIAKGK